MIIWYDHIMKWWPGSSGRAWHPWEPQWSRLKMEEWPHLCRGRWEPGDNDDMVGLVVRWEIGITGNLPNNCDDNDNAHLLWIVIRGKVQKILPANRVSPLALPDGDNCSDVWVWVWITVGVDHLLGCVGTRREWRRPSLWCWTRVFRIKIRKKTFTDNETWIITIMTVTMIIITMTKVMTIRPNHLLWVTRTVALLAFSWREISGL